MKYARLENNIVMEIIDINPEGIFSPELIFVECDDDTTQRMVYDNGTFIEPTPIEPTIEEQQQAIEQQLANSDIETLYDILKSKGVLTDEDIPEPIQVKLESKAALTSQLQSLK